jgi:hypothetical protein
MPKPPSSTSFSITATRYNDAIEYSAGVATVNGTIKAVPAGVTKLMLSSGAGDDVISTDAPQGYGGTALFYDGGRGADTLDLSGSAAGVAVRLYGYEPTISTNFQMVSVHADPANAGYYDAKDPKKVLDLSGATTTANILNFESVIGSAFDDYIGLSYAAAGRADGGAGDDWIEGGIGSDFLFGGEGNDYIEGRAGNDTFTGGLGADSFQVLTLNGNEVITDLNFAEGDWLYVGQQESSHAVPTADSWRATTYVDVNGVSRASIASSFEGGSVTLVGLTLEDVPTVMSHMTVYNWFG